MALKEQTWRQLVQRTTRYPLATIPTSCVFRRRALPLPNPTTILLYSRKKGGSVHLTRTWQKFILATSALLHSSFSRTCTNIAVRQHNMKTAGHGGLALVL